MKTVLNGLLKMLSNSTFSLNTETTPLRCEVTPEDIGAIKNILLSSEIFTHGEIQVAVELVLDHLMRREHSGYSFLFAETVTHQVVGYTCFGPITCTQGRFDLYWIAVHAHFHRMGIGSLLLKKSEQEMAGRGAKRIFIETSSQDKYLSTRRFYQMHGYKAVAEVKHFYSINDSKIIFEKVLDEGEKGIEIKIQEVV